VYGITVEGGSGTTTGPAPAAQTGAAPPSNIDVSINAGGPSYSGPGGTGSGGGGRWLRRGGGGGGGGGGGVAAVLDTAVNTAVRVYSPMTVRYLRIRRHRN
jgi:hypothetical protein